MTAIYSQRPHLWLRRGWPLICPRGPIQHNMKTNAKLLEHGVIVCQWRASGSQGDCGAHAYVLVCPDRVYLTEVTPAEMRTMLEGQFDVDQVLAYLSNPSEA